MIIIAQFLPDYYAELLQQTQLFVSCSEVNEDIFLITGESNTPSSNIKFLFMYSDSQYDDGDFQTTAFIRKSNETISFRTGLRTAMAFVEETADKHEHVEELLRLDARQTLASAAANYDIAIESLETRGIGSAVSGYHITKWQGRYLLYSVDTYGSTVSIADSETPALLVYLIHSFDRATATNVAGRSAQLWRHHHPEDFLSANPNDS